MNNTINQFVLASHNTKKIAEFTQLFAEQNMIVRSQAEFDIGEIEETGFTFIENAILKARHVARKTQLPALADDSGLVVPALNGAPGIYSARYAGEPTNDQANIDLLLNNMQSLKNTERNAFFVCTLVYLRHEKDPMPIIVQSTWRGTILTTQQGNNGFGYDPVFYLPELKRTAAELSAQEKNDISHRGQALRAFFKKFNECL